MQKALIFPLLALLVLPARAQNSCSFRLLRSAQELSAKSKQGLAIKGIHRSDKNDSILIKTPDRRKLWLASSAVWGFQDSHCTIYRNAFHDFLKTEEIGDSIITYSRTYEGFRGKRIKSYYFSKRFDAPAFKLDKANIHEQFRESPDLIDKFEKRFNL